MVRMRVWAVVLAVAGVLATGGVAQAATWTVDNYADPSGGTCQTGICTLRHAVSESGAGDTIEIPAANGLPVQLTQGAPIVVDHALTITGDGAGASSIDGSGNRDGQGRANRIFKVTGGDLQLAGVTLQNGGDDADETCQSGCSTITSTGGGALYVAAGASAELTGVDLTGNRAGVGGAIASAGTLSLTDVAVSQGSAAFGGGLFVRGGSATVQRSSFDGLGEGGSGGGAAFVYGGTLTLSDSTVTNSGWASSRGGGLENYGGRLTLSGVTLAGNLRGAIMTDVGSLGTTVTNTLVGAGFDDFGDWACVPAGLVTGSDSTTAQAITSDGGHNLDEDGHCGLTGPGSVTGDAHLAPLADNGGPTPTMALLHGSPALDAGTGCSNLDQRSIARPQGAACDIGAFEAVRNDPPAAATTEAATDVSPYSATLHATVDLTGEAGGAHFEYGTAPGQLTSQTAVAATGQGTAASVVLDGLQPNTTYYFRAVADNASGQRPADDPPLSFKTALSPPSVSGVEISGVDDTSATLSFDVDTGGADTSYVIEYGPDDTYGQSTAPVDIGSQPAQQAITAKLTGLKPGSAYHVNVVATNSSAPDGVSSGDAQFVTDPQVDADAGSAVTITDRQEADFCPDGATIDWGDGSPAAGAPVSCDAQGFSVTASHAYTKPGHFKILIAYGDAAQSQQWALIAAPAQATPTPTPTPTPAPSPTPTPPPPPPAPQFHRQVVVKPVSGTVLVRLKGSKTFVPVSAATGVPLGSQVDVTHGRIRLSSVPKRGGKPQTAVFYGGIFTVTQPGSITDLRLSGPKPTCRPRGKAAVAATRHKKVRSRSLWGDGHGNFRTRGTYSAATVRGTKWFVQDTCAGTLTRVVRGVVSVRDNVRHRTRLLRAGQRYLARPRKH